MVLSLLEGVMADPWTGAATLSIAVVIAMLLFVLGGKKKIPPAMDPVEFQPFRLSKKEIVSHDTRRFTFDLQTPSTQLGLPVGQHITLKFTEEEAGEDGKKKSHQRSYTPVTGNEVPGKVTFVIKVYKANVHPKFPDGGKMSQHLDSLEIGDSVMMRGPKGHMTYQGQGKFTLKLSPRQPLESRRATKFGMIAGGTGITPMLQVIHAVLRDSKDSTTEMSLIYANQSKRNVIAGPIIILKAASSDGA
jgi:cytochrome-b5 reductase